MIIQCFSIPGVVNNSCLFLEMCQSLVDNSLEFKCTYNGISTDCAKPMIPGTRVIPQCKITHQLPTGLPYEPIVLTCLPDGKWNSLFHRCVPSIYFDYY